jgi:hypothetical protein
VFNLGTAFQSQSFHVVTLTRALADTGQSTDSSGSICNLLVARDPCGNRICRNLRTCSAKPVVTHCMARGRAELRDECHVVRPTIGEAVDLVQV